MLQLGVTCDIDGIIGRISVGLRLNGDVTILGTTLTSRFSFEMFPIKSEKEKKKIRRR